MNTITQITDKLELERITTNSDTLAHALNLSPRRIYQLVDDGVLDKQGARFDFVKSLHNYIDFLRPDTTDILDIEEELKKEQTRLTKARADKAEVEAELALGKVAPIEDMADAWESIVIEVRSRLLNIPNRATMRLIGETNERLIKEILNDEIKSALTSLVDEFAIQESGDDK